MLFSVISSRFPCPTHQASILSRQLHPSHPRIHSHYQQVFSPFGYQMIRKTHPPGLENN